MPSTYHNLTFILSFHSRGATRPYTHTHTHTHTSRDLHAVQCANYTPIDMQSAVTMNENEKQEEKKYRNQKGATMCEIRQARAVGLHMGAT